MRNKHTRVVNNRMKEYEPTEIELKVQKSWSDSKAFEVSEDSSKEKFYCLSMFPYPSGRLHMGHVRNYTIGDVISRYQRMNGKNVLQPMGWDAFGMPAENAAIKNNVPPAKWTYENIDYMRDQLKRLGFAYDWSRELATCKPEYYHWEQWLFTKLYEKGLVYKKTSSVNWCPNDNTVLANEQVNEGRCWRCDTLVERKEIPQWFMKISQYAEELLEELDKLEGWPDSVKTMQRNWIGRSEGLEIIFDVENQTESLSVYTTRPDTLMGVSYLAVATEHPLALMAAEKNSDLDKFIKQCRKQDTTEASLETMEKRGIATEYNAIHPITGELVPVWAANFVLMAYGTGAVMSVPAHDQRDFEFAIKYKLPIKQVIFPSDGSTSNVNECAYVEKGVTKNSLSFDNLNFSQAFDAIDEYLSKNKKGERKVNYRLRDWGVSRQRYWGTPIPMINCQSCGILPVPEKDLPVILPEDIEFDGVGSPIKKMPEFYQTKCPKCKAEAVRETDTFDTFFESSWYYARYACPDLKSKMLDSRADYWLPVDQYIGGIEHAVMHLLYARFFNKLMRDVGLLKIDEPFTNLLTQGMVVAETFFRTAKDGKVEFFSPAEVDVEKDSKSRIVSAKLKEDGLPLELGNMEKMSKSKNNGVDPQHLIERYGADTVRLFSMFAAPPVQSLEWNDDGVEGAFRFLKRVWRYINDEAVLGNLKIYLGQEKLKEVKMDSLSDKAKKVRSEIHKLLGQLNRDVVRYHFNTVVAAGMKLLNVLNELKSDSVEMKEVIAEGVDILLRSLHPVVPHITSELWSLVGCKSNIIDAHWPVADSEALQNKQMTMAVLVNGKRRAEIEVSIDLDNKEIENIAKEHEKVSKHIKGMEIKKVIIVPSKLINIVVGK